MHHQIATDGFGALSIADSETRETLARHRVRFAFGVAAMALLSMSMPDGALAQKAAAEGIDAGEIIVTAQRREERAREIPLTMSVLPGAALEQRGIANVRDLAFAVPSLGAFEIGPGQNLLQIRGVSTFRGTSSLVGVYLDETPLTGGVRAGTISALDFHNQDLARVEVLKGPQGTLFGEGAIGGVIRYITKDPILDRIEGRVAATASTTYHGDSSGQLSAVLNLPLATDTLGFRIAATHERNGGWIENVTSGVSNYNDSQLTDVRAKLLWSPTPRLDVRALVDIHRLDADGTNIVNQRPFKQSRFRQAFNSNVSTKHTNDFEIYNLTANYDLDFATLTSSTSRFHVTLTPNSFQTQVVDTPPDGLIGLEVLVGRTGTEQRMTSQEVRLSSNGTGPVKWIVGGNYKLTRTRDGGPDNPGVDYLFLFTPPLLLEDAFNAGVTVRNRSEILTGFGDGSITLLERLELGGGVRVYRENQRVKQFDATLALTSDRDARYRKTTYRGFAKLRASREVNLYANVATGFRSGELNLDSAIALGAPDAAGPETSIFYEAGIKASLLGGKLTIDLAGFEGRFNDQIQSVIRVINGNLTGFSDNVGKARIRGVEWQAFAYPAKGLTLGFTGDVTRTKILVTSPQAPLLVGDPIDFVPKYNLNLTADYRFDLTPEVKGFLNLSSSWKGPMQATNRDTGLGVLIDRTGTLNFVQASVGAEFDRFEASLFVRNLTNERGRLSPQFSGIWPQGRPRSIGASIAANF